MRQVGSLNHSRWECKYHVVFIPKYRKKAIFIQIRRDLGEVLKRLAQQRESPEVIRQGVADTLASYGKGPGHVFNLGHGITPDIDPDHLGALVDAVHEQSPEFHR